MKNTIIKNSSNKRRRRHRYRYKNKFISNFLLSVSIIFLLSLGTFIYNKVVMSSPNNNDSGFLDNDITYTVCIDAGHGDWDEGAIGFGGSFEKDIDLSVALKLGTLLEANSINVIYTRTTDTLSWSDNATENLYERVNISKKGNSDLFISIHCNATDESYTYNGVETWYNPKDSKSENLATLIQDELSSLEYTSDRGVKGYGEDYTLAVLEHNNVPSALIELGFLSNWSDEEFLNSESGQAQIAKGISNAILNYKDSINAN